MNITFLPIPAAGSIRGDQLEAELAAANVGGSVSITKDDDGEWCVSIIGYADETDPAAVVAAHVPDDTPPPATADEKIAELVDAVSVLTDVVFGLL